MRTLKHFLSVLLDNCPEKKTEKRLSILQMLLGRRPGARKGGGVLLGTGPLERDEENTRSFAVRLEAVNPGGFGKILFLPGHLKKGWENKFYFF